MCPSCAHPNSLSNRFCAACGFQLDIPQTLKTQPPPAKEAPEEASWIVLTALNPDGAEAGSYSVPKSDVFIGRDTGEFFTDDQFLSPQHAEFRDEDGTIVVEDNDSLNGVFRKLLAEQPYGLAHGQVFRMGQELIRYESIEAGSEDAGGVELMGGPLDGIIGRITMVLGRETGGTAFPMTESGINLGRERGAVLFPEDGYVSGLHCRIYHEDGSIYLTDLGSSNGTFVQLEGPTELSNGDILLMGQQLYRVTF